MPNQTQPIRVVEFDRPRKIAKSLSRHLKIDAAKKATEIREKEAEFPPDMREAIQALQNASDPQVFVEVIEESLLGMIEESILSRNEELPCTDQELEVAIRCFPNALWYPLEPIYNSGESRNSKLFQLHNIENFVPFVPVFAKLGMESGWYSERERGGLMTYKLLFGQEYGKPYLRRISLLEYICTWSRPKSQYLVRQAEHARELDERTDRICARAIEKLGNYGVVGRKDIADYKFHVKAARERYRGCHEYRLMQMNRFFPELNFAAEPNRKDRKEPGSLLSDDNEDDAEMEHDDF